MLLCAYPAILFPREFFKTCTFLQVVMSVSHRPAVLKMKRAEKGCFVTPIVRVVAENKKTYSLVYEGIPPRPKKKKKTRDSCHIISAKYFCQAPHAV